MAGVTLITEAEYKAATPEARIVKLLETSTRLETLQADLAQFIQRWKNIYQEELKPDRGHVACNKALRTRDMLENLKDTLGLEQ